MEYKSRKENTKLKESFPKNPYRSLDRQPKWELGVWGYVILGALFLVAAYFLKWDIILVTIGIILLVGFGEGFRILWFDVIKRSRWELIVLILFLIYLLVKLGVLKP